MPWFTEKSPQVTPQRMQELVARAVEECRARICRQPKRVLLLPPDITRMHSGAGRITELFYNAFADEADVHVIPTLGQHLPHTHAENRQMFGAIPSERILAHDWRGGVVRVGEIPVEIVQESCGSIVDWPIPITLNRMLMEEPWDLIINVGHIVPHEVLGFANHNKNYFIGLGGKDLICAAHMMAAVCGIENNLGNIVTPVRHCFNWAEEQFLVRLPDVYFQVVMARSDKDQLVHTGVYVGDDLETYLQAALQSREQNITTFEEPLRKVVCVMQGDEFFSTWVANKAVYRTRMALADGGELLIIAPGLKRFGEQPEVDAFIRKYGYCGTANVMQQYRKNDDMQDLAHATAHLIHGSSEGRFQITYAPGDLSREEIERVGYRYMELGEAIQTYKPQHRRQGLNMSEDGEKFYFIPTPSAGLWSTRKKLNDRLYEFARRTFNKYNTW
jgi:nickel-dependent lactate racemase